MFSRAEKGESRQRVGTGPRSETQHGTTAVVTDHRSEAIQLRGHQELADNSPQVQKLAQLQRSLEASRRGGAEGPQNKLGMPDHLKTGIEAVSGFSMDDVRVHYNSNKPAQLNAHAYAQGSDIHLAPGQEKYLPHEAWHVVQQKQGRVKPTQRLDGKISINDDEGLEREADSMGTRALQRSPLEAAATPEQTVASSFEVAQAVINPEKLKEAMELLSLAEAKVVEVPKSGSYKGGTKFGDYPDGFTSGLSPSDLNKTIAELNFGDSAGEYADTPAIEILGLCGGAGYLAGPGIAFVSEGMANYQRSLTHELGHHKQNVESGYTFENTTVALLEYHNVLLNENLFGGEFRVSYATDMTTGWVGKWQKTAPEKKAALVDGYEGKAAAELNKMHEVVKASKKPMDVAVYQEIMTKLDQLESSLSEEDVEHRFTYVRYIWNLTHEAKAAIPT